MATKVKPSRLNVTGTPQAGQVPVYVDEDSFQWGANGVGDVTGPNSSTDGDIVLFDGATGKKLKDSGKKPSDYQEKLTAQTAYTSQGTSSKVPQITTNTLGQVTGITEVTITHPSQVSDTAYGSSWDGVTDNAPSKNALYDKISTMDITIAGKADSSSVPTKVSQLTNDSGFITSSYHDSTKQDTLATQTAYTSKGTATKVPQITTNSLGQVTGITEVDITYPSQVSDTAYASSRNGVTTIAPSKNAVYDKIAAMDTTIGGKQDTISDLATIRSGASAGATALQPSAISDTAYASSWDGVTTVAPSKNAVYDKISAMDTTISGKQATLVSGTNIKTINSTSLLGSGNISIAEFNPGSGTTGQVVTKTANGYEWANPSGGDVMVSSQANNILTSGMKIWAGTQANYENLGTYDNNTLYLTIE